MLQLSCLVLFISCVQQKITLYLQQESHCTTRYAILMLYISFMYGPVQHPGLILEFRLKMLEFYL